MVEKDFFLKGTIARDLDFYRIREKISQLTISEEGKEELLKREACSDLEQIKFWKKLGREWNKILNSNSVVNLKPWPQVKDLFIHLKVQGSQLLQDQIFALGLFCISSESARENLNSAAINLSLPNIKKTVGEMESLQEAKNLIFSIIDSSGQVKDLPALREIKSRIANLHKEIENAMRKYTSNSNLSKALQSNVPAFKADRELLAVKAEFKNEINGIVHELSTSGQTVYIEPEEVIRANNELVQEEFKLQAELRKIFLELTEKLSLYQESFVKNHKTMLNLDQAYAAARWQNQIKGIFADDCLNGSAPKILQARHPLLEEKAIPIDINFSDGKNVLIITGPNTGGKTVTLKTIALFALLNQAGFPVPAAEGTRLNIYNSIFADIGDEQSIDDALSTFSSHMKKIALMLNNADENSLILLDELGSGTDPQEGSAIAMATLDSLLEKKSFVIVTTHHGILKNYGYTNPKCMNASVEFNSENLKPTYHLLMGIPGESHAIDIAKSSGLPDKIIEKAKSYINTEQTDVSTLIKGLNQKHIELDELMQKQIQEIELYEKKQLKIHKREIQIQEKEILLKEKEHKESSEFLRQTRSKLENLVRELREGEINRDKTLSVKKFITDLSEQIDKQEIKIENKKNHLEGEKNALKKEIEISENGIKLSSLSDRNSKSNKKTKQKKSNKEALVSAQAFEKITQNNIKTFELKENTEVLIGKEKRKATLLHKVKDKLWQVQIGSLKMTVEEKNIVPVQDSKTSQVQIIVNSSSNTFVDNSDKPKFELRLLGMRYEEALKELEKQLDLCVIHNFKNFSIIHGKGNGILQQAVHNYLSNYPGIADFKFAQPEDGGTGKTYVSLI